MVIMLGQWAKNFKKNGKLIKVVLSSLVIFFSNYLSLIICLCMTPRTQVGWNDRINAYVHWFELEIGQSLIYRRAPKGLILVSCDQYSQSHDFLFVKF